MERELKNSANYIQEKAGKKTGFNTPSDYFDAIEQSVSSKLSEEQFNKEKAFEVPNNYFNNLESTILSKVAIKKEPKVVSFKERILKIIPYAAAACIVLFIGSNMLTFNKNTDILISDNEIEFWLETSTIHSDDIASVFEEDILEENDFSLTTIKDETIEDYINTIDNSSILNEIN
ncbi:hypothetical protein [Polaribacter porphyrae]|uniref:Uncharacterized protein n=1 Tax=Polaribacter porphyrae TaxID=1137780 RepID=A0A2S7WMY1_9FLAO|nr:hypothetical protein [Polaribacter porphyrae]PQJ78806.1 hypothetical protein BTO18_06235 [Polaribacter porphyrae]